MTKAPKGLSWTLKSAMREGSGYVAAGLFGTGFGLAVTGFVLQRPEDWGTPLAAVITVSGAALLGELFGLRDYARKQERDEVSRRFVDEGFDRAGVSLVQAYDRAFMNLDAITLAAVGAQVDSNEAIARNIAALDKSAPEIGYAAYRITLQFPGHLVSVALMAAQQDLMQVHDFCVRWAPMLLGVVADRQPASPDSEEVKRLSIERIQFLVRQYSSKLEALRHSMPAALAELSAAFQSAQIQTSADAIQPATLEPVRKALGEIDKRLAARMAIRNEIRVLLPEWPQHPGG